ncbi:MAG: flagellar biosynthesis anti-sigma factor FlgM [Ideonella sp.]|nr:flagellar biosynthesis anti-sigma factor FlgM [Ideonella sp.]MCC7457866.1 flagellar biosynthesis anti-sigma factor FlgM [Nitrospira sp.]
MKIGPLENKPAVAGTAGERKSKAAEPAVTATSGGAPEPSAKVELSAAGSAIASVLADGSFDAQKVERLSRAIREGTYRIDAEAIADKLISNTRELLEGGKI